MPQCRRAFLFCRLVFFSVLAAFRQQATTNLEIAISFNPKFLVPMVAEDLQIYGRFLLKLGRAMAQWKSRCLARRRFWGQSLASLGSPQVEARVRPWKGAIYFMYFVLRFIYL